MNYVEYKNQLLQLNDRVVTMAPSAIFGELVLGLLAELEEVLVYDTNDESLAHEVGDACAYIALIEYTLSNWGYDLNNYKTYNGISMPELTKAAYRLLRGDKKTNWAGIFITNMLSTKQYILNMVEHEATEEQVYALNIAKLQKRIDELGTFAKD